MKNKLNIRGRLLGAVAIVAASFIGATPITAFAGGPDCTCEHKCTADKIDPDCELCKYDYTMCEGEDPVETEPEEPTEPEEEKWGPLTPDGNMTLVDDYGGINVDITRAERNALNGMVASKKRDLQSKAGENMVSQHVLDMMEEEYHLNEFGPETKLNGLQAVGFGWLQYDSVYNCCERDIDVVAALFKKISEDIKEEAVFYTDQTGVPDLKDSRRAINLDHVSEEDKVFLMEFLSPIMTTSYNNLTKEEFMDMALAFASSAYVASREGVDIFDNIEHSIFPLEAKQPYDIVAGTEGHLIDFQKNSTEIKNFLYAE